MSGQSFAYSAEGTVEVPPCPRHTTYLRRTAQFNGMCINEYQTEEAEPCVELVVSDRLTVTRDDIGQLWFYINRPVCSSTVTDSPRELLNAFGWPQDSNLNPYTVESLVRRREVRFAPFVSRVQDGEEVPEVRPDIRMDLQTYELVRGHRQVQSASDTMTNPACRDPVDDITSVRVTIPETADYSYDRDGNIIIDRVLVNYHYHQVERETSDGSDDGTVGSGDEREEWDSGRVRVAMSKSWTTRSDSSNGYRYPVFHASYCMKCLLVPLRDPARGWSIIHACHIHT